MVKMGKEFPFGLIVLKGQWGGLPGVTLNYQAGQNFDRSIHEVHFDS